MTTKEKRNQIYEWVKKNGVHLDHKNQTELKNLIVQYGELIMRENEFLPKVIPKDEEEQKEENNGFTSPKTFG